MGKQGENLLYCAKQANKPIVEIVLKIFRYLVCFEHTIPVWEKITKDRLDSGRPFCEKCIDEMKRHLK